MKKIMRQIIAILIAVVLVVPSQAFAMSAILEEPAAFSDRAGGGVKPQFSASTHVLMLRADGRLLVWGDNRYGQLGLGDGAADKYSTAQECTYFRDKAPIKQAVAIENASYVLLQNGEVYTCGQGANGRLGQGLLVDFKEWRQIKDSVELGIFALFTNPNSASVYAITADDSLLAVGKNDQGQLGIGSTADALSFTKVMDTANIRSLHIGKNFAVILHMDGVVKAAGAIDALKTGVIPNIVSQYYFTSNNNGAWYSTHNYSLYKPIPLVAFCKFDDIPVATQIIMYNIAQSREGANMYGERGTNIPKSGIPKIVSLTITSEFPKCLELQYGNAHGIMQRDDGTYIGWGDVTKKQLLEQATVTDGVVLTSLNDKIAELELQGYEDMRVIVAGDSNYLTAYNTITSTHKTFGWGSNTRGKLGVDSETASFAEITEIPVLDGVKVEDIVAGTGSVYFVSDIGTVYATGDNAYGQLGLGDTYNNNLTSNAPQPLPDIKYSETAPLPDPVAAVNVPAEIEVDKDITVDWGKTKGRSLIPQADSYLLTRSANGGAASIVYQGDATSYTEKAQKDWTTAEYEVYTINYVGDMSQPVRSPAVTIKAADSGSGGGSGGGGGGSGGGIGGGTTNVTVRPDITVNMPKTEAITGGSTTQPQPPQYNILPSGSGEPYQLIVNMPEQTDYTQLALAMLKMMDKQTPIATPITQQPSGALDGGLLGWILFLLGLCAALLMLSGTVHFCCATLAFTKVRSEAKAETMLANQRLAKSLKAARMAEDVSPAPASPSPASAPVKEESIDTAPVQPVKLTWQEDDDEEPFKLPPDFEARLEAVISDEHDLELQDDSSIVCAECGRHDVFPALDENEGKTTDTPQTFFQRLGWTNLDLTRCPICTKKWREDIMCQKPTNPETEKL